MTILDVLPCKKGEEGIPPVANKRKEEEISFRMERGRRSMNGPMQQIYWIAINPVFLIRINLCNRFIGLKQFQTPMWLGISTPGAPQHPLASSQGNSCVYTSGTEHRLPSSAEIPVSHKNMAIKSTSYNVGGSLMAQRFLMFQVPRNSSAFLDDLKRDGFEALKPFFQEGSSESG